MTEHICQQRIFLFGSIVCRAAFPTPPRGDVLVFFSWISWQDVFPSELYVVCEKEIDTHLQYTKSEKTQILFNLCVIVFYHC